MTDYLITGAHVVDGSGAGAAQLNVGIKDDRICYIGSGLPDAARVIDAGGLILCPGFIDTHTHSEFTLMADGRAEAKICQGVTTEINGNCGLSAAPLLGESYQRREADQREYGISERWLEWDQYYAQLLAKGISVNFATLLGHGNVRASVLGYRDGSPTAEEMAGMKRLVSRAMEAGCRGLSTGLIYPPGVYSSSEEIIELASVAASARPDAIYASHMRSEGDGLVESVEETLGIGRASGLAVHISHIKTSGSDNWHKIDRVLELLEEAIASGMRVTCDRYPYIASSTDLDTIIPSWAYAGGVQEELRRLKEPETLRIIRDGLMQQTDEYWRGILISSVIRPENAWMAGKSIYDIAQQKGLHPADAAIEIIISEEARAGAIFFSMCEDNLRRFLGLPYCMIGTDSSARSYSGATCTGVPHPRGFGSFPRVIARYVREEALMPLGEAVRRMTSLPAAVFGLGQRGLIREGWHADITVFDYDSIQDTATFSHPFSRPEGIKHVFVNGRHVLADGLQLDVKAGRRII